MSIAIIIFIALALAMDAFAVSICSGASVGGRIKLSNAISMAGFFGSFQAIMPFAGWSLGRVAAVVIRAYDHWAAFGLLVFIGCKMIYESFSLKKECRKDRNPFGIYTLFALAFATSLDAAAVGVSLSLLETGIIIPSIIIGAITFLISFTGIFIGEKCGGYLGNKAEITGGAVLIGIGFKILIEHLFF